MPRISLLREVIKANELKIKALHSIVVVINQKSFLLSHIPSWLHSRSNFTAKRLCSSYPVVPSCFTLEKRPTSNLSTFYCFQTSGVADVHIMRAAPKLMCGSNLLRCSCRSNSCRWRTRRPKAFDKLAAMKLKSRITKTFNKSWVGGMWYASSRVNVEVESKLPAKWFDAPDKSRHEACKLRLRL